MQSCYRTSVTDFTHQFQRRDLPHFRWSSSFSECSIRSGAQAFAQNRRGTPFFPLQVVISKTQGAQPQAGVILLDRVPQEIARPPRKLYVGRGTGPKRILWSISLRFASFDEQSLYGDKGGQNQKEPLNSVQGPTTVSRLA